jgi:hypothetical protein
MPEWKGFTPAAPRFFADASDVAPSNMAAAITIRADLGMLFLHALGALTSSYALCRLFQAERCISGGA